MDVFNQFQIVYHTYFATMPPIFYCKCSNCVCRATVLLTEKKQELFEKEVRKGTEESVHENDETQKDGGIILPDIGQEYTYLVEGWDTGIPTEVPNIKSKEDESGFGSLFLLIIIVLLIIGNYTIFQSSLLFIPLSRPDPNIYFNQKNSIARKSSKI